MVIVPSGQLSDFLATNRADAVLLFPKIDELLASAQTLHHLQAKSFLKVDFPFRVKRVGFLTNFGVTLDQGISTIDEMPVFTVMFTLKAPVPIPHWWEVFLSSPLGRFMRMSTLCPAP